MKKTTTAEEPSSNQKELKERGKYGADSCVVNINDEITHGNTNQQGADGGESDGSHIVDMDKVQEGEDLDLQREELKKVNQDASDENQGKGGGDHRHAQQERSEDGEEEEVHDASDDNQGKGGGDHHHAQQEPLKDGEEKEEVVHDASYDNQGKGGGDSSSSTPRRSSSTIHELREKVADQKNTMEEMLEDLNQFKENVGKQKNTLEQMANDLNQLKAVVESQSTSSPGSQPLTPPTETVVKEYKEKQKEIDEEEAKLEKKLDTYLEKSIITMAPFFISFHMLLANAQQSSNNLLDSILIFLLTVMIGFATFVLLFIWWCKIEVVGDQINSLKERQSKLWKKADAIRIAETAGIRQHIYWNSVKKNSYRAIIISMGVFAVIFSVYFGSITYSKSVPGNTSNLK